MLFALVGFPLLLRPLRGRKERREEDSLKLKASIKSLARARRGPYFLLHLLSLSISRKKKKKNGKGALKKY